VVNGNGSNSFYHIDFNRRASTLKGFTGTILDINLTTGNISTQPLNQALAERFLGGAGYAIASLFPLLSKETDPLGPDNILFFMTGPLCGTMATSTGRMVCCAKSPYSGILGEANCGSDICVQIKKAGFDGIILRGAATKPLYLEINDDKIALKDAAGLWGKGIYEVHNILKANPEMKGAKVMAIGPAGENLVKYAIIGSEERAFGRTGMGAVMGSKKLKAMVIKGSKKVEVADPEGLKEFTKKTNADLMEVTTNVIMQQLGTSSSLDMYNMSGELPVGYFRKPEFPEFDNISGATLAEKFLKKNRHCFSCPIGCGRIVGLGEGNQYGLPAEEIEGPEYETLAGFGSLILNGKMELIFKANYLCNDWGLDTISASSLMGLLMDNLAQGKIKAADLDGIDLKWGDMDGVFALLKKTALGEGCGKILAEGSVGVAKKFGIDLDQVAAVRNIEVTYHDMRAINGMSLAYGISPHYGGSHNACDMYMNALGVGFEEIGVGTTEAKENTPHVAHTAAGQMCHRALYSSIVLCVFCNPSVETISNYIKLVTGTVYDVTALKHMGERILNLKRLFNLKMGHTPKDEHIPKLLLTPIPNGGQEGNVPDYPMLHQEFYKFLEWDPVTGMPSQSRLEKLELEDYAQML
jgi:aldehyde:ferredoxin oxidoreductase